MLNSTYTFSISSGSLSVLPIIVCPMLYRFHAGQQRSSSFQVSAFTVPVNSRLQKVYKTLGKATHYFFFYTSYHYRGMVGRWMSRSLKILRMRTVNSQQLWGRDVVVYTKDISAKRWHCGCIDFAVDAQSGRR